MIALPTQTEESLHGRKTVVAFGELLWDLLPSGPVLGGAPANFAYRMSALGDRGVIITRLGRDPLGKSAFEQLAKLGMETRCIQWDDELPTGTVQVQIDSRGNPDFFIVPGVAYDRIQWTENFLKLAAETDCVCFGTLIQRADESRHTLHRFLSSAPKALKLLDLNLRKHCYTTATITQSLEQAEILKLNEDEVKHVAGLFDLPAESPADFAQAAVEAWNLQHCLISLGERGAFAASRNGEKFYSPGYRVHLGDTCGSGDACSAGFLHGLLRGESTASCLEAGNALGAIVATQNGATQPIAPADLEAFLAVKPARLVDPALRSWSI